MRTLKTMLALLGVLACISAAGCRKDGAAQPETVAVAPSGPTTAPPPPESATPPTPPPPATADASAPTAPTEPAAAADALPNPAPIPSPAADTAPPAGPDGQALVQSRCVRCHSVDRVNRQTSRDRAYWTTTVQKMVSNGARLDAAEQQAVIDYLAGRP
jgi:mono/diheme cytochrome c family protein